MIILFFLLVLVFSAGAVTSLLCQKNHPLANWITSLSAAAGSVLGIILSVMVISQNSQLTIWFPSSVPLLNFSIYIDSLAALFLLAISVVALCSSIFGLGYMKQYYRKYNLGLFGFFYNFFLLSLFLVVTASNSLYFLAVWELMSLTSYFMVIFDKDHARNIRAGFLYLIMTHLGTLFITIALLALYQATGSLEFSVIKESAGSIPELTKNILFICALIGFGTKAGIIPLHIWLPEAHPAAPSHVSALMSGVMVKTAIFMMIKLFLDILPGAPLWWGLTILSLGAVSTLLGVLYALAEHDLKRLLAYHSVENIGIILLGVGGALIFTSQGLYPLAALSLIAGLYHTINHALFKSLLFLGAGSVISQTGSRNMEEYGGLIKRMPATGLFFLIGAIAISALPPFNGFTSEWLTFQSLFNGLAGSDLLTKIIFIMAITALAFTGGLAAACFVKAFGVTFLARPRSSESSKAQESGLLMCSSMAILAILCLVLGVFGGPVASYLSSMTSNLSQLHQIAAPIQTSISYINVGSGFAVLWMPAILLTFLLTLCLVWMIISIITVRQKITLDATWGCGYLYPLNQRAEITATGFSLSLVTIFKRILQPSRQHSVEYSDASSRYFTTSTSLVLSTSNVYRNYLYLPFHRLLVLLSLQVAKIQSGNLNLYLLYIFLLLIGLLIWSRYY